MCFHKRYYLQTISETKVKSALKASGEDADQEKFEALVCLAVDQEKLILQKDQEKKVR